MQCPKCNSTRLRKNGHSRGRQKYQCKDCGRSFTELQSTQLTTVSSNERKTDAIAETTTVPIVEQLEDADRQDGIALFARNFIQTLNSPAFLESIAFGEFSQKVRQLAPPDANGDRGLAILLLDAENLNKFNAKIENFLDTLCTYPLQVKIAFANWRNTAVGKLDTELYDRGYQLIHVPLGKNSADAQMIAMGASICRHYSDAKEVFVCSSDWLLTHLCNELQSQGLTVYRVRKQENSLIVENRRTGAVNHYSLNDDLAVPDVTEFLPLLENLINTEREAIGDRLSQLSVVANLFQERYHLTTTQSTDLPETAIASDSSFTEPEQPGTPINSREELEQAFIHIIQAMNLKQPPVKITAMSLSKELHQLYGEPANSIIRRLKLAPNVTKFLKSCQNLQLKTLVETIVVL